MTTVKAKVYEETKILEAMFNDSKLFLGSGKYPEFNMEEMRAIYLDNPTKFNASRYQAYETGNQSDFLSQPAEIVICYACGTHCYYVGSFEQPPVCPLCNKNETMSPPKYLPGSMLIPFIGRYLVSHLIGTT